MLSEVKAAVNANDAWNQSLWIPPASSWKKKMIWAHEGGRGQDNNKTHPSVQTVGQKNLTDLHIRNAPYLGATSSSSAHWLRGARVPNWRLIADPSIAASFSCRLTITESNVVAQQHKCTGCASQHLFSARKLKCPEKCLKYEAALKYFYSKTQKSALNCR